MKTILVTGGAGYIGSHTCVELAAAGFGVVVVDNLVNSRQSAIARAERIAGVPMSFYQGDIDDGPLLRRVIEKHRIHAVIHFAGLKAVGESVAEPLRYYRNNIGGTMVLLDAMADTGVGRLVFSSSATVYAPTGTPPLREDSPLGPGSPYGHTKLMLEQVLTDVARASPGWKVVLLRYFNPVGAHASGQLGEDPLGIPNNLMPFVSRVAAGRLDRLSVWGNDYLTPDGTGVRDYVHVVDLALGHVAALRAMETLHPVSVFNLGTGRGYSVLEVIAAFERASGKKVPYDIAGRRPGDVASCFADPHRANEMLGWVAARDMDAMCRDAWRWQSWSAEHPGEVS